MAAGLNWTGVSLVKFVGTIEIHEEQAKKAERKIAMNGKRVEKQREGEKGKETLITETLTHKKGEADTSGNQRNVVQLWDTSMHSALFAVFLLKAQGELDRGWGRVVKEKDFETKTKLKDELKPVVLKPCGPWMESRGNQAAHL